MGMRFSRVELKHLAIGGLLVTAVGVTLVVSSGGIGFHTPLPLAVSAVIFGLSFMVHELAHKFVAQGKGLWAEFRVYPLGAMLTLVSLISPIKLIAPGAVVIAGRAGSGDVGRTALAGPVTNILLGVALAFASVPVGPPWGFVLGYGALLNMWLAVFNLIPFGVLDGFKIFSWSRRVWGVLFSVSLILLIYLL
ncbi:MAG: Zn-dependent protease [Candidatus Geothermarchaeales archaeon]